MMSGGLRHRVSKLRNVKHGTNLGALGLPDSVGMVSGRGKAAETAIMTFLRASGATRQCQALTSINSCPASARLWPVLGWCAMIPLRVACLAGVGDHAVW
jgi:hypothetical protein